MDQAGLFGLFDFTGYFTGLGSSRSHSSFQFSVWDAFLLYEAEEARMRQVKVYAEEISRAYYAIAKRSAVKAFREAERNRNNWASAYTTLLAEV